jgi:CNP1-like family
MRSFIAASAVLAITVFASIATAQRTYDPAAAVANFDKAPWEEQKTQLPGPPSTGDLIAFDAGPTRRLDFFVDAASVSVGVDGVVRFTVVAKSDSASNVSYEGIRCQTAERKVYAHARPDGTWYQPKDAAWAKIGNQILEGHRFVLYQDYFCPARVSIKTAAEGVDALKRGGHPRAQDLNTGAAIRR